jgi:hypothetical protein
MKASEIKEWKQIRQYSKKELEEMGNCIGTNFKEWHELFECISHIQVRNKLSELELYSIVSNRFDLKFKGNKL